MRREPIRFLLPVLVCVLPLLLASEFPRVPAAPSRPPGAEPGGIAWQNDLDGAFTIARKENRPMLIEFWADWCGPCHMMEKNTFAHPRVMEAARRFVPVRIDFDRNPDLARSFEVWALPAILMTDSYGMSVVRLDGYADPQRFLKLLRRVPEDISEFNAWSQRLAEKPNDFKALLELGLTYRRHALLGSSSYFLRKAVEEGNVMSTRPARLADALFYLGENHLQLEQLELAVGAFTAVIERFPGSERVPIAHLELGKIYYMIGKPDRAREHLQPLLGRGDADRVAQQAREVLDKIKPGA